MPLFARKKHSASKTHYVLSSAMKVIPNEPNLYPVVPDCVRDDIADSDLSWIERADD